MTKSPAILSSRGPLPTKVHTHALRRTQASTRMAVMAFSRFFLFLSLLLAVSVGRVHGQQFEDDVMGLDFPQLSEDCLEALNTTAAGCPGFLIRVSVDNRRLIPEELTALCTTTCRASLTTVRSTIAAECTLATDVMEFDGVVWPGSYPPSHRNC